MIFVVQHSSVSCELLKGQMLNHLLSLSDEDRYLRFGYKVDDSQLKKYLDEAIKDPSNHWFLAINVSSIVPFIKNVVGVAMLNINNKTHCSELAISVDESFRSMGVARKLMEIIFIRARLFKVKQIYVLMLSKNKPMKKIAEDYGIKFDLPSRGEMEGRHDIKYGYFDLSNMVIDECALAKNMYLEFQKDWLDTFSKNQES